MKQIASNCPVVATLNILSNRWKFLIIRDLLHGPRRFGELKESVAGISPKALTTNLRELTETGLITRTFFAEIPPRTEYALTELGQQLRPIIGDLAKWGLIYQSVQKELQVAKPSSEADSGAAGATPEEQE